MANLSKEQQKEVKKEVKKQLGKKEKYLHKKITKQAYSLVSQTKHKVSGTTSHMTSEFRRHASTALIAAFSFLIALAWKDLIVKLSAQITPSETLTKYPFIPELVTAIIVTIFAIIGIILVSKWIKSPEKKK